MKVKCLENVCASGSALEAGGTYDISNSDYALLSSMGKVIEAPVEESNIEETNETEIVEETETKTSVIYRKTLFTFL